MTEPVPTESVQYITNTQGQQVGVVLDLATYQRLTQPIPDADLLVGLDQQALLALAAGLLAPPLQAQLDDFLARNAEAALSGAETAALDQLLAQIDQLNLLKARAMYTLQHVDNAQVA